MVEFGGNERGCIQSEISSYWFRMMNVGDKIDVNGLVFEAQWSNWLNVIRNEVTGNAEKE